MASQNPMLPSPMSAEREAVLRGRLERGETLARPEDQPAVTESIKRRHVKTGKNGHTAHTRRIGQRSKHERDSKFDDDGELREQASEFSDCDRYLSTEPGTAAAALALRMWKAGRELRNVTCSESSKKVETAVDA